MAMVSGIPHSICVTFNFIIVGLLGGKVIGLPPVLNFGSQELKAKVVPEVLSGKKFICLAISEAHAGSDVMGLKTTAVKSPDGKEWIINGKWIIPEQKSWINLISLTLGSKKWISNGTSVYLSQCI